MSARSFAPVLRLSAPFRRLWTAHLVSSLGSGVTGLAIPLIAALMLDATPTSVGILTAVGALPHVLLGLFAGALVDRAPVRTVLIVTDLGRAAALSVLPIASVFGVLSMPILFGVVFIVQAQTVVNDLASGSAVPRILPADRLAEGNSALAVNGSVASLVGNGLGGGLVHLVGAAFAIVIDAVSYLISSVLLFLGAPELTAAPSTGRRRIGADIRAGLVYVARDRMLIALCLTSGVGAFAVAMRDASLVLALVRQLHLSAMTVGLLAMTGGVGGVIGGLLAGRITARFGFRRSVLVAIAAGAVATALLAAPFGIAPAAVVAIGQFAAGACTAVYGVGQQTMRQLATPAQLLGRVNATRRFLVYLALPIGGLVGGLGGSAFGSRSMLIIAAAVLALSLLPLAIMPEPTDRDPHQGSDPQRLGGLSGARAT